MIACHDICFRSGSRRRARNEIFDFGFGCLTSSNLTHMAMKVIMVRWKQRVENSRAAWRRNGVWQAGQQAWQRVGVRIADDQPYGKKILFIFFLGAFFLGASIKAVSVEALTMGYDDYSLRTKEKSYDLRALGLAAQQRAQEKNSDQALPVSGEMCQARERE